MKDEPNPDTRKKNCTFGQLCDKEKCGFRHRLSFANREKLIVSYKFNKICPSILSTENTTVKISSNKNDMQLKNKSSKNLYLSLDDDINDDINDIDDIDDDINDIDDIDEEEIKPKQFIKSWVDIVINSDIKTDIKSDIKSDINSDIKSKLNLNLNIESKWEDIGDEDYLMEFDN